MGKISIDISLATALAESGSLVFPEPPPFRRKGRNFNASLLLAVDGPGKKTMRFGRGEVVFTQGDIDNHVYYILQGIVKLSLTSKSGKEGIVGLLGPGDFFGESGLCGKKRYDSTASASTVCSVVRLGNLWMGNLLGRDPVFSDFFMGYLLMRKARVEADLADQIFNFSEKRLARALLVMAGHGNHPDPGDQKLPRLSQETLAAMVGTTRSRVSFFMNRFRELGYVKYNGGIEVRPSLVNVLLRG